MNSDPRILSVGCKINRKDSEITFVFDPKDWQTIVDRGLKATMWVSVSQSNDLDALNEEIELLKIENAKLRTSNDELSRMVGDRTGNA